MITIGLPLFNAVSTLQHSIASVFAQEFCDWRLILVDDGSTDGSGEIARAVRDPRVTVISDGKNKGLIHRLNQIADMTETPLLARMDADDIMHPDRLRSQVEYLSANPAVQVVGTAAYVIDEHDAIRGVRGLSAPDFRPAATLRSTALIHPSVCGRTAWFRKYRYRDQFRRAEDHELWCRASIEGGLGHISEPLLFYRDPVQGSGRKYVLSCNTAIRIYSEHGPAVVGSFATAALIAGAVCRRWSYSVAEVTGLEGWLTARRNVPLSRNTVAEARRILWAAMSAPVPGLSI